MPLRIEKNGEMIRSVDDWFRLAPPKRSLLQWKDGRSAKELAKAFCSGPTPAVPSEILTTLETHPDLRQAEFECCIPEHVIGLDSYAGETRNADLVMLGSCAKGRMVLSIEAKADEPFGDKGIGEYLQTINNPRSNVPNRIAALSQALLPDPGSPLVPLLRYQLLHAVAGTLIYAAEQSAERAVFMVYEILGPSCRPERLAGNQTDLDQFVTVLAGVPGGLPAGTVLGPIHVRGGGRVPATIPLYLAKTQRGPGHTADDGGVHGQPQQMVGPDSR